MGHFPWITMLLIGKPSISMGHLYHGYVSHNQMVWLDDLPWFTYRHGMKSTVPWLKLVNYQRLYQCLWFGWGYLPCPFGPSMQLYPCLWFWKRSARYQCCMFFGGYYSIRWRLNTGSLWYPSLVLMIYFRILCSNVFQILILISSHEQFQKPEWLRTF